MIDLFATIEKIRRQPEHIRLRWVYGSVFVSMLFVLFIWTLSLKVNFGGVQQPQEAIDTIQNGFLKTNQNQQPSLEELTSDSSVQ